MTVFLVMAGFYEDYMFLAAFTSRDLAERYIAKRKNASEVKPWMDCASDAYYEIIEAFLDSEFSSCNPLNSGA